MNVLQELTAEQLETLFNRRDEADYKVDTSSARIRPSHFGIVISEYDEGGKVITRVKKETIIGWGYTCIIIGHYYYSIPSF